MGKPAPRHIPVMADRVLGLLAPALSAPGAIMVDATLGLGGHSAALLAAHPDLVLVGLDRDQHALDRSAARLAAYRERVHLVHAVYDDLPDALAELGIAEVHGVLFDLGVSSMQLDETDRGFAYSFDAPLDMRMDPSTGPTAAEVLNTYPAAELTRILREYGEERYAQRIARAVVTERERAPFDTSARLVRLLHDAMPAAVLRTGGHPAKRTFQALRIEVNSELDVLRAALPAAVDALAMAGRIVVLAYHSLEDRMVKHELAGGARSSTPPGLPVELPDHAPRLRLLTRGAEKAEQDEIDRNPRSASVRLRAAERIARGRAAA